jgi:hypothetical protein
LFSVLSPLHMPQLDSPIGLMMTAYGYQDRNSVMVQGVSFVVLAYMSICTYWPLFQLNIGWAYKLQGPQQSSPFSLIFNAEYLSRLQFAIGYNFLMYLNVHRANNTAFNQLMKHMELVPVFGTSFQVYIPLIMILVALLTLFDGYGRLVKVIGIEWEDSVTSSHSGFSCSNKERTPDPALQEKIRIGRLVILNELKRRDSEDPNHTSGKSNSNPNGNSGVACGGAGSSSGGIGIISKGASLLRLGVSNISEAFIPAGGVGGSSGGGGGGAGSGTRYRNLDSYAGDVDTELEMDSHRTDFGGGRYSSGNVGSTASAGAGAGASAGAATGNALHSYSAHEEAARNSLFSFSRPPSGAHSTGGASTGSGATSAGRPPVHTDLFSLSGGGEVDGGNIYGGGRYSNSNV